MIRREKISITVNESVVRKAKFGTITNSALEIIDIASLLGYSNASAFTRAFRRWSSATPAKWRAVARGEA